MVPAPQEAGKTAQKLAETGGNDLFGDEVVISGISGLFPSSDNTTQFVENLLNNVDLVTQNDLNFTHPEAPKYYGKISDLDKFDAQFFKVVASHAEEMEPQSRKLLEQAYMAIYDSGINPAAYRGKKVGVFVGSSYSDRSNDEMFCHGKNKKYVLSGCGKSMFANRISYWIDGKGPSYNLDCGCISSMVSFDRAVKAIKNGEIEAAIVGGSNLCLDPNLGVTLRRTGTVSIDGKTRCFDKNADGAVRAEAINCIFIQKAKDAKRIYAEVVNSHTKYALKDGEISNFRKKEDLETFFNEFYSKTNVSPQDVEYIEANGSATLDADKSELEAIDKVFARDKSVKVGCVKSNMGNSEPASGVCALTKVCLAYHKGQLPANLHYSDPADVPGLKEGRLQVLTSNTPFNRGYAAINNFGLSGINCHVLLKGHYKPKDTKKYECDIPRLVLASGRKEESVDKIFDKLENEPFDPEIIGMMHNIYKTDTLEHTSRGYTVLDSNYKNETVSLVRNVTYYSGTKRPLWLVFSGMGSQWPGMAADLMRIPIFANAMYKCNNALKPMGVDLIRVLTEPNKETFDNVLNCFIGISAVQIGLVDVLKAIGINPDYIIGHSQGEMGCAYFDDTFTTEESILAAYSRGIVSLESQFIKGSMAAVGLGYKDIKPLCPPEIDVACHNSDTSATLSGPADVMKQFVAELTAKGIFAREVPSTGIAFHSRYIKHAGPAFLDRLKKIVSSPKPRSPKWISTSIPEENWNSELAKYSSAEYHTNNLLSSVLFEEAARHIPDDAVVVEVAPHGLLQAILKRSHPECVHIPLTKKGVKDELMYFFEAIGKIYQEGFSLKVDALYPQIEFPVSTETRMISQYVDWEHSESWKVYSKLTYEALQTSIARTVVVSVYDEEFQYLSGHNRDGETVFPESAMLYYVWETLAMHKGVSVNDLSVAFKDVHFYGDVILRNDENSHLGIAIHKGNDYFEVTNKNIAVASGYIAEVIKPVFDALIDVENCSSDSDMYTANDIYTNLHSKGMTFRGDFQSIRKTNFKQAEVRWTGNWITFLDSLIQLNLINTGIEGIVKPKLIKKLTISVEDNFKENPLLVDGQTCYIAKFNEIYEVTRCAGVEIRHLILEGRPIKQQIPDVLESLSFVPYNHELEISVEGALLLNLQIVADNSEKRVINVLEIGRNSTKSLSPIILKITKNIPNIHVVYNGKIEEILKSNLIVVQDLQNMDIKHFIGEISKNTFILVIDNQISELKNGHFNVISSMKVDGKEFLLLKKKDNDRDSICINIRPDNDFAWLSTVQSELQGTRRVVLLSERQPHCGLFGLVKRLQQKYPNKVSAVIVDDYNAPAFKTNEPIFKEQLQKGLTFNVLTKGKWGSYFYLPNSLTIDVKDFMLVNIQTGLIDGLRWSERVSDSSKENIVQVCFAGPSMRDAQKIVGVVENTDNNFGYDFSGFDKYGKRVMGLVPGGAIASTVKADPDLLWPVPEHWSLEEAATVPLPYTHACYLLAIKCQLQEGQTVFVCGGAGALGQAVISISLALKCRVFTSVSDLKKKQFLLKLFPQLEEKNVGCSLNGDFKDLIKVNTTNKRCDFVISCANGSVREAAMKCVSECGVFLDANVFDRKENRGLGMSFGEQERNYIATDLQTIFHSENVEEKKKLQMIMAQGITNGLIRPLTHVMYSTTDVSRAFRLLSLNRHRGRVLLKIKNAEIPTTFLNVIPRATYSSKGTYVVVCDETDLGIELANRLVRQGAKKLLLHLKSKNVPGFLHLKLAAWQKYDASVKISTENLNSDKNCLQLLNEAEKFGSVQGIFVIEDTTDDKHCNHQTFIERFKTSAAVIANLDVLSRNNCPQLSTFAVISRSTQNEAEAYASSAIEKIFQARRMVGLPATSLKIEHLQELQEKPHKHAKLPSQNVTTVLNALEIGIKQQQSNFLTYNLKKENPNVLVEIEKILGVKDINDIDEDLLVGDLIISDINLSELKNVIKNACQLEFSNDNLSKQSIKSLKKLSERFLLNTKMVKHGLGIFYNYVDKDECNATNIIIPLETLIKNYKTTNELNGKDAHVFFIPGFEGHYRIFNSMCQYLKVRAAALQLGPDMPTDNIHEIALKLYEHMKKTFELKSKFYLFGYSFGVNVALEVAEILEKNGLEGVVFCLDSSPDSLPLQLEENIGKLSDSELQDAVIDHMYKVMTESNTDSIIEDIKKSESWSDKLKLCIDKLKRKSTLSKQYQRDTIETAYKRILLAKDYKLAFKLKSQIVLIKCVSDSEISLGADYGLSKYSEKPVKVYEINSDHESAPRNIKNISIVNSYLDPELLEEFKSLNLCDKYLIE